MQRLSSAQKYHRQEFRSQSFYWRGCLALLFAGWIVGCSSDTPASSDAPQALIETEKPMDPPATAKGDLHLNVKKGVIVRAENDSSSPAIRIVDHPELLKVVERQGDFYRVRFPGGEGWIRSGPQARELRILSTRRPPQASSSAEPDAVAAARRHLTQGGRDLRCGPYNLLTDVDDATLLASCSRLASRLDEAFAQRYGLTPVGEPGETLILFRSQAAFRAFAQKDGPDAVGYAGHARAADGYMVLYVGEQPIDHVIQTLVHEMTHLVSRRALGAPLPRWLSEGLADGLGDPASPISLGPIQGLKGAEAVARRVLEIPELPNLERLTALDRGSFDRGPSPRDYEQSAIFVRFLMSDPERTRQFQAYLRGIARGNEDGPTALAKHLELGENGWWALNRELRQWLQTSLKNS